MDAPGVNELNRKIKTLAVAVVKTKAFIYNIYKNNS